jgi:hypothetical protein
MAEVDAVVLSVEDKLTVKTLETEVYKAQINLQGTHQYQKTQEAMRQLNEFLKVLTERYDRDPKEYILNLESLTYVPVRRPSGDPK